MSYEDFQQIFMDIVNKHAPIKTKVVRANNAPFMNKLLSKEFMKRSKLKNVCCLCKFSGIPRTLKTKK